MWSRTESLQTLNSIIDGKLDSYTYKLARYYNKVDVDLRNYTEFTYGGFNRTFSTLLQDSDLMAAASTNVIKSVIDSLVSKLAQNKVRPYFTPINGLFETRQTVKAVQSYFDTLYDNVDVHNKIAEAFREACIFDIGYIFINPFNWNIDVADTWTVAMLSTERKKNTKLLVRIENYPTTDMKIKGKKYVQYAIYIDTIEHKACEYIDGRLTQEIEYKADILPIVPVYFNEPVVGCKTISVVDELEGIQSQIDLLNAKISTASQLTPANVTYVYENSSLKAGDVSNKTGLVYSLDAAPGSSGLPIENVTPVPMDPSWQNMLDYWKALAYEIIGISQLSAQSKKPSGLDSGTALQTMEDIESDRFETQVSHYVNAYVNLARTIIAVTPDEADILPDSVNTSKITWGDVKEQQNLYKIQFSAESSLSKDPQEKVKEIMQMTQTGLIPVSKVANYLDMPDLQEAYRGAAAVQDAIDAVIANAINREIYTIPDFVNYQQLSQEIALTQNRLFACTDNVKARIALMRLKKLDDTLNQILVDNGYVDMTPDESQVTDGADNGGLGIGAQQSATQAISSADTINADAMPQQGDPNLSGGNEDIQAQ